VKILLINPPDCGQGEWPNSVSNPVLGLLYLVSYVRDICEVDYIDGFIEGWSGIEEKLKTFNPDVVGTQILTPGRFNSFKVLEEAKKCGAITIAGGPHASIMHKQIFENYPYVDYIVKGEGEKSLRSFIKGNTKEKLIESAELDIDSILFPAWDLGYLDSDKYIGDSDIRVPVITSRGCMGNCIFCSTHKVWKKYRVRNPLNVADEIEYIVRDFGKTHFVFEDDSLSCDIETSKQTLREIAKRNLSIRFFATMRADGMDSELARLLKEAGCYGVSIGFESGSQGILDILNKHISIEQNIEAAKIVKEANLKLCALMIFNGIGETDLTREQTQKFLEIIQPDDIGSLQQLWVLPGTELYNRMKEANYIDDNFWLTDKPYYVYGGELG